MFKLSFSRLPAAVAALSLAALAGCSQHTDNAFEATATGSAAEASVQQQHLANLRVLEEARQTGAATYEALMAAWRARTEGSGPMTSTSTDPFVPCQPLPFDGDAQIIGANGGVFYFGPHRLYVPEYALTSNTSIAVMVDPDLKTRVTLLPHGQQFRKAVKLTLAYDHCTSSQTHRVAFIDSAGNVVEWQNSNDRPWDQKIDGWLNHFSDYAIAY